MIDDWDDALNIRTGPELGQEKALIITLLKRIVEDVPRFY